MAISDSIFLAFAALMAFGCANGGTTSVRAVTSQQLWLESEDRSRVNLQQLWTTHRATLLVFWSSQCPCVRRYQSRVEALALEYPADQLLVVGIASNAGESLDEALLVARQRGIRIPVLGDDGGQVARAVDARSTPTVVLIDQRGTIRYRGWVDNERLPGDPDREPWLERAIQGVLQGHDDFATRSPVYGCSITRSLLSSPTKPCCRRAQAESKP